VQALLGLSLIVSCYSAHSIGRTGTVITRKLITYNSTWCALLCSSATSLPLPSRADLASGMLQRQPWLGCSRSISARGLSTLSYGPLLSPGTAAQVRLAVVTASFKSQEDRDKWVGDLKAAVPGSRDETGTLSYQLSYGVNDPLKVVIIERCAAPVLILVGSALSNDCAAPVLFVDATTRHLGALCTALTASAG